MIAITCLANLSLTRQLISTLDGYSYKLTARGLLSNTSLVALVKLRVVTCHNSSQNVAMTNSAGGDDLGDFYR
jgi:hypothetical protein